MSTIAENLQGLYDIKEGIKIAIESKGVAVGDARFSEYSTKIQEITVGGGDCEGIYQDGYNSGYTNGYSQGKIVGYNNGYDEGFEEGFEEAAGNNCEGVYNQGVSDGYQDGYYRGYQNGKSDNNTFSEGYSSGYTDGIAVNNNVKVTLNNILCRFNHMTFDTVLTVDCSKVDTISSLFADAEFSNDEGFSLINTENLIDVRYLYMGSNIKRPLYFDTNNVLNFDYMFTRCFNLIEAPQFNTTNAISLYAMFYECESLTTVPLLNTSNVETVELMFSFCKNLTHLGGFLGLKCDIDLSASDLITRESMLNVFDTIGSVRNQTITISQAVADKLSDNDMTIATIKGWTINVK